MADPTGTVTAEFGDGAFGGEACLDPEDYLGRFGHGESITLLHGRVTLTEYDTEVIYVRGDTLTGWISLARTTFAYALWTGTERLVDEPAPRPPPPTIEAALLAELVEHPDNRDAMLVLGDTLTVAGDPRGELVALQDVCARNELLWHAPGTPEHERGLVQRAAEAKLRAQFAPRGPHASRAVWRLGHLHAVDLYLSTPELLAELVGHPSARFLADLQIFILGSIDPQQYIELLHTLPQPCALRRLSIGSEMPGDLSKLWRRMPRLRRLSVRGSQMCHGRIDLPLLTRLDLEGPRPYDASELARGNLGALEEVTWEHGRADDLGWLLQRTDLPRLRTLAALDIADVDRACGMFSDAIAGTLVELELRNAPITAAGAVHLDHDRWKQLRSVLIGECDLPESLRAALGARFEHVNWDKR